jgi:hypothetical protein
MFFRPSPPWEPKCNVTKLRVRPPSLWLSPQARGTGIQGPPRLRTVVGSAISSTVTFLPPVQGSLTGYVDHALCMTREELYGALIYRTNYTASVLTSAAGIWKLNYRKK